MIRDVKLLPGKDAARPAKISDEVRDGTAVRTGVDSRAELTFTDQTLARLGANTIFTFNEGTRDLELGGGAMLLQVPKNAGGAKIKTALVTAAITGTTIMLEYHANAFIKFIVLEGTGRVDAQQPARRIGPAPGRPDADPEPKWHQPPAAGGCRPGSSQKNLRSSFGKVFGASK